MHTVVWKGDSGAGYDFTLSHAAQHDLATPVQIAQVLSNARYCMQCRDGVVEIDLRSIPMEERVYGDSAGAVTVHRASVTREEALRMLAELIAVERAKIALEKT